MAERVDDVLVREDPVRSHESAEVDELGKRVGRGLREKQGGRGADCDAARGGEAGAQERASR